MPADTTIHPFPELRATAESEARVLMCAMHAPEWERRTRSAPRPMPEGWATADAATLRTLTEAHLTLLCDLTRPASRDAVCRLVAKRVGWQAERVIGAIESSGSVRNRLYRKVGTGGWCNSAPVALSMIVRHLWPEDSTDAR